MGVALAGWLAILAPYRRTITIGLGVAAVVVGGFDDQDLRQLLGRDLGVAATQLEPHDPVSGTNRDPHQP